MQLCVIFVLKGRCLEEFSSMLLLKFDSVCCIEQRAHRSTHGCTLQANSSNHVIFVTKILSSCRVYFYIRPNLSTKQESFDFVIFSIFITHNKSTNSTYSTPISTSESIVFQRIFCQLSLLDKVVFLRTSTPGVYAFLTKPLSVEYFPIKMASFVSV